MPLCGDRDGIERRHFLERWLATGQRLVETSYC
jgi:hypothetical protein